MADLFFSSLFLSRNKVGRRREYSASFSMFSLQIVIVLCAVIIYQLFVIRNEHDFLSRQFVNFSTSANNAIVNDARPVAWVRGKHSSTDYLRHIKTVFKRIGFRVIEGEDEPSRWNVLWSHEYPMTSLRDVISNVQPTQLINHIPGSAYYTFKVLLATAALTKGVPKSFALPSQGLEFKQYAKDHPKLEWVQKSNAHREIRVLTADNVNLLQEESFVQQYINNPLLIDGKKFDIGIYTVVTSLSPLRVYIYENEILLRFCSKSYHPFDPVDLDKYVVGDDYTPFWEMPTFRSAYNHQKLSFKSAFAQYLQTKNKSIDYVMKQIRETIQQVFEKLNHKMRAQLSDHNYPQVFFELSRFDFLVDEDLNVFLMEANMSPNLSSQHFKPNALLYEQLLVNIFSLLGITQNYRFDGAWSDAFRYVEIPERSLHVPLEICKTRCGSCPSEVVECSLCAYCMPESLKLHLSNAYVEHLGRREMRRVVPKLDSSETELTSYDWLQKRWFQLKCKEDVSFC